MEWLTGGSGPFVLNPLTIQKYPKDNLSPAQKLYGHPVQDTLPAHRRSFAPEWQHKLQEADVHRERNLQRAENYYNSHAHELPDIHVGSSVAIQHPQTKLWETYGTVIAVSPHRKYYVKTQSGRVFVRNRRFIKKRTPLSIPVNLNQPVSPVESPSPEEHSNQSSQAPVESPQQLPEAPRHSTRIKHPTRRLIEDPTWN